MDKHTLVIIIVTTAVSTTVTTVLVWTLAFAKLQITSRLIPKAKTTLGKRILVILVFSLFAAVNIWDLHHHVMLPTPPTRSDVLWIVIVFAGSVFWSVMVIGMIGYAFSEKKFGK